MELKFSKFPDEEKTFESSWARTLMEEKITLGEVVSLKNWFSDGVPEGKRTPILEELEPPATNLMQRLKSFATILGKKAELPPNIGNELQKDSMNGIVAGLARSIAGEGAFAVLDGELCFYEAPIWVKLNEKSSICEVRKWMERNLAETVDMRNRNLKEIVDLLKTGPALQRTKSDFLPQKLLINCRDGIYDVIHRKVVHSSPSYGFFSYIDISAYDIGKGYGAYFEGFMDSAFHGDCNCRRAVLELIGIVIANLNIKKFFLLLGESNTGKSQLGVFLQRLVGDNFSTALSSIDDFKKNWTTGSLEGKRICSCLDLPDAYLPVYVISVIKQLVGDDPVRAEKKYKDPFFFYADTILLFASNHKLKIPNVSSERAFLKRLAVIPFNNPIPERDQIPQLYAKLLNEAPYIIGQAVFALEDLANRNFVLTQATPTLECIHFPDIDANSETAFQIAEFVRQKCVSMEKAETTTAELYGAYRDFCAETGAYCCSQVDFARKFQMRFPHLLPVKRVKGTDQRGVRGIMLSK